MPELEPGETTPPKQQEKAEEQEDKAEEDIDFEITLGTRRDAASEAGSEDLDDEAGSEGFITGKQPASSADGAACTWSHNVRLVDCVAVIWARHDVCGPSGSCAWYHSSSCCCSS